VDAVDECPETHDKRHLLLQYLAKLGPTVNLMITSRPHITPIEDSKVLHIHANDKEIQTYVGGYIKKSSKLSTLVKANPELQTEIETKISSAVNGM
jgi:hypothetical protein